MVFVGLAVLMGTYDGATWRAVVAAARFGELVQAPSFIWSVILSTAAWLCFGSAVPGFAPGGQFGDWLRCTAAVAATSATGVLVLAFVGYQVWR